MREDHKSKDNTVGSRQKPRAQDLAYIAGFLDGDGSIMIQIKRRSDSSRGWRMMGTVCFYQDQRHNVSLGWIRNVLGIGYLSNRHDHITELRINGFGEVRHILTLLKPYIKFKQKQTEYMLRILARIGNQSITDLPKDVRCSIADDIISLRKENYQSHQRKYTDASIKQMLEF